MQKLHCAGIFTHFFSPLREKVTLQSLKAAPEKENNGRFLGSLKLLFGNVFYLCFPLFFASDMNMTTEVSDLYVFSSFLSVSHALPVMLNK